MAAPTLQAQGSVNTVTTGDLTVTLPAHQTDDILVVTVVGWVPNTGTGTNTVAEPSGWSKTTNVTLITSSVIDGEWAIFWKRATSSSETDPTFTRPSGWDTGNDTAFGGRAYVIRGCVTSGDPFDETVATALLSTANQNFSAVTVSGPDRLVVQFYVSSDNNVIGAAPSGWTAGTSATDNTGTDTGFQTYRITASTSTSADNPTIAAPAQGDYVYFGVSYKPPVTTVQRSATGSGAGSAAASRKVTSKRTASGSGAGSSTATRLVKSLRTASGDGAGSATADGARRVIRTANGTGSGDSTTAEIIIHARTATGTGTGDSTANGTIARARTAAGLGAGASTATALVARYRTATGSGSGTSTALELLTAYRTASGTGQATSTAIRLVTSPRTASGTGHGDSTATPLVTVVRTASGDGTSDSTTLRLVILYRNATGSGQGDATAEILVTIRRNADGNGTSGSIAIGVVTKQRQATGNGTGTASADAVVLRTRNASGTGESSSDSTWRIIGGGIKRTATGQGTSYGIAVGGTTAYLFFTLPGWQEPAAVRSTEPRGFLYSEPSSLVHKVS